MRVSRPAPSASARSAPCSPRRESIAIRASHLGFGHNPTALWVIADRLAQDPLDWRPFTAPRHLRALFATDHPA